MTPAYISIVIEARCDVRQICTVRSILELVFIRAGHFVLSDMRHITGLSACEIKALSFCAPVNFYSVFLRVHCSRFYNKNIII